MAGGRVEPGLDVVGVWLGDGSMMAGWGTWAPVGSDPVEIVAVVAVEMLNG